MTVRPRTMIPEVRSRGPVKACRVCRKPFFAEPLLHYQNMPRAAQFFPEAPALEEDQGVDLEIVQCSGCGLVQLRNHPVSYYREVIRAAAVSREMENFRREQFGGLIRRHSLQGKKIIEIGCGRGEYLGILQDCGAQAYGIEDSEESVQKCGRENLRVFAGFIENGNSKLKNPPYDGFLILNFLEHLPDPNGMLRGIRKNLTEEAVGLVEVPNFDMILRKRLFSEFIGDHLLYFTKETLTAALQINGFEILSCQEIWHDYVLSAEVRNRKPFLLSHFRQVQEELGSQIKKYISRFGSGKVAVWGAGHQALAVLSLAHLSDKIRYVVDSADFKQGKFTPASHIPVVSPDRLKSDPVDAVIVMAAGYSDEVAATLRRNFDHPMHVAIVREDSLVEPGENRPGIKNLNRPAGAIREGEGS